MAIFGNALMFAGLVLVVIGFWLDIGLEVPAEYNSPFRAVVNLHLLFIKGSLIGTGSAAFIAGAIFRVGASIGNALLTVTTAAPSVTDEPRILERPKSVRPPELEYPAMFRYGGEVIYYQPAGRAWAKGRSFTSADDAKAFIDRAGADRIATESDTSPGRTEKSSSIESNNEALVTDSGEDKAWSHRTAAESAAVEARTESPSSPILNDEARVSDLGHRIAQLQSRHSSERKPKARK